MWSAKDKRNVLGTSDYKRIPEPSRLSRPAGSLGSALPNRHLHSDSWNGLIGLDTMKTEERA